MKILWKTDENQESIVYILNTATYGTKYAPFLATRVVKQIALDESANFPLLSEVVLSDIYMNDIVTACQDLELAKLLKDDLIKMFQICGMTLHKWHSNCEELNGQTSDELSLAQNLATAVKTLGIVWRLVQTNS